MAAPRLPIASVLLLALLLPDAPVRASSSVYRTVDANGNVQYTDRGDGNAVRVPVNTPAPQPTTLAQLEIVRDGEASEVFVNNRLGGPLEVDVGLTEAVNVLARPALPLRQLVPANARVRISRIEATSSGAASYSVGLSAMPGDPRAMPANVVYGLPVDEHSGWRLGQSFHGGFSHTDEQNRYAVDLVVPEGTPVLAARDGVVMQVESGFDRNGLNRNKYVERANLIRVLHDDGSMGVYAHLKENGVYVSVGQRVNVGEQIGASGNTGYSSGPHLHFAVQVNRGMKLVSVPFRMLGGSRFLPLPGNR